MQDSALFRYLAVTTHIQITMGKRTHFIGQYREPDTDGGAEAAGAEMELLGTDHNGQNSADVLCGFTTACLTILRKTGRTWRFLMKFRHIY